MRMRMKPVSKCLHLRGDHVRSRPRASGARCGRYQGGVCEDEETQERDGGEEAGHEGALLRRCGRGAVGRMNTGDGGLGPRVERGSRGSAYICKMGLGWCGYCEVDVRFESIFDGERARR